MFPHATAKNAVFAGRYRIVRPIAQGGMGAVYEAIHTETERACALKVMLPRAIQSPEMQQRFKQEARIASKIRSENIVDVLDAGVDAATSMPFIVMDLLNGEELDQLLNRQGKLSFQETLNILSPIAAALDKVHDANIIHRDLKPSNLFICSRADGTPLIKILDFGIAKMIADGASGALATRSIGTPLFMAPEQFRTDVKISSSVDIYAIGMLAFMCLTGNSYWSKEARHNPNPYAVISVIMAGPKEAASLRAAELGVLLPNGFDVWFAKATAFHPGERFARASMAIESLRNLVELNSSEPLPIPMQFERNSDADGMVPNSIQLKSNPASTISVTTLVLPPLHKSPRLRSKPIAAGLIAAALCGLGTLTFVRAIVPAQSRTAPALEAAAVPAALKPLNNAEPPSMSASDSDDSEKPSGPSRPAPQSTTASLPKMRVSAPSLAPPKKPLSQVSSLGGAAPPATSPHKSSPPSLPLTRD